MSTDQILSQVADECTKAVSACGEIVSTVNGKMGEINAMLEGVESDAKNIVSGVTEDVYRANIGMGRGRHVVITPLPNDDTGNLVNSALNDGANSITVDWPADGQCRHWNTAVYLPVGATLHIAGPMSVIGSTNGVLRTDRSCWANASDGGVSNLGSPMVFRNTMPAEQTGGNYYKIVDPISLIFLQGNNIVRFGTGVYMHDEGGMLNTSKNNGLINVLPYNGQTPNYIIGGGAYCNIYLSSGLVNNQLGGSICHIKLWRVRLLKTSSDGPEPGVDKGFNKLKSLGVIGITEEMLRSQPSDRPVEWQDYNDRTHPQYGRAIALSTRGIGANLNLPRVVTTNTWSYLTGSVHLQFAGSCNVSLDGLEVIGNSSEYRTL